MLNYIHGELWRALRKTGSAVFFFMMLALPVGANAVFAFLNFSWRTYQGQADTPLLFSNSLSYLSAVIPLFGCLLVFFTSDLVFGDELRFHTLKNSVASGMGRGTLYFGKLLAGFLYSLLGLAVAVISLLVSGLLLLPWDLGELPGLLGGFFLHLLACIPLWLGVLGFLNFLLFSIQSGVVIAALSAAAAFFGLLFLSALPIADPVSFYLPAWFLQLSGYAAEISAGYTPEFLAGCWGIGLLYTAVFSTAGFLGFFRRELK